MKSKEILSIISCIKDCFLMEMECEITIEANPTSFESLKMEGFEKCGINRISIGVQSFDDENLIKIGRKHSSKEAFDAIKLAEIIFPEVSFDLMFGLPNQSIDSLRGELDFAMSNFTNNHISLYNLTIEKGTDFFSMHKKGKLILPVEDEIDEMHNLVHSVLIENDFNRYEVSNYAKRDKKSMHNIGYWKIKDYIGIGAGAHGRVFFDKRFETMNIHTPSKWADCVLEKSNGLQKFSPISIDDQIGEILIMGLRIFDGIDVCDISDRIGINLFDFLNISALERLSKDGFVKFSNKFIKPTVKGIDFVNYISKEVLL